VEPRESKDPRECSAARRTVLLVDDTELVRTLAQFVLSEAGYETHTAESGAAALAFLKSRKVPIDVLVTDLTMPQMNGFELMGEVQKLSPATRIVLMTGYLDPSDAEQGETPRPDLVISKPFRPPELLKAVDSVLSKAR
jgi:CheY-like chemotaxis protein